MKQTLVYSLLILLFFTSCYTEGLYSLSPYEEGYEEDYTDGEQYNDYGENPFRVASQYPVSTFSVDADGASYSNVRRLLNQGREIVPAAVRTEEFINYFTYDYPEPGSTETVGVNGEVSTCPWAEGHQLVRIGLKGKSIPRAELAPANFVLLVDVSGSMHNANKLPLLKNSFVKFAEQMRAQDRLAIVTYSGSAAVALEPTVGSEQQKIIEAIGELEAGGRTAGADGINKAYAFVEDHFVEGGNNRVILATDGDFNVGPQSQTELVELIEKKRESGIYLTVLGVGGGNLNDAAMEQIANHGNGNYEYLDTPLEAQKVFVDEFSKFYTVAQDVKVQVTFNPEQVEQYRLIGYENRMLDQEDFEDDTKDAAEIGSGQTITALYEVIPTAAAQQGEESFAIQFRYKKPAQESSRLIELSIINQHKTFEQASENMRFAASAAGFALLVRGSEYMGSLSFDQPIRWADNARTFDPNKYREGMVYLMEQAKVYENP